METLNFYLKPTLLRGWVLIRETKNCYVVRKYTKDNYLKKGELASEYHLPKKNVVKIEVLK